MRKALLLFLDGLDSLLASKIIQEQGIEVIPVTYITPFFNWKYFEILIYFTNIANHLGLKKAF